MINTIPISEDKEISIQDYIKYMFSKAYERKSIFFLNPFYISELADSLNLPKFQDRTATLNIILSETETEKIISIFDFVGVGKQNYLLAGMSEKDYCKLQRENRLKLVEAVKPITGGNYNLYSISQFLKWRNDSNFFNK